MSHRENFLEAVRGIPVHHVIAAMDYAVVGVRWRHCSKGHMADKYARAMNGERWTISSSAVVTMPAIDLKALRTACLNRMAVSHDWYLEIQQIAAQAIRGEKA